MSKWVTFYIGILCGYRDFMVHKDRKALCLVGDTRHWRER